jgi:hypothetical protein
MKLRNKILIASTLPFILSLGSAAASPANCIQNGIEPNDLLHCIYISGLNNPKEGRFIRADYPDATVVTCSGDSTAISFNISNLLGTFQRGPNTIPISICTDASGTNCVPLTQDKFAISQDGSGNVIVNPKYFEVNLSGVASDKRFQTCTSTWLKNSK